MSLAVIRSRALAAASAPEVTVEVNLANGLPAFTIVGLPDLEVKESRERVRAALQNCQFDFPVRRITVNLAPADLPKESGHFDLPIALGILAASGQLPLTALEGREFAGELSLTGALRPMRGAFAMVCGLVRQHRQAKPHAYPPPEKLSTPLLQDAAATNTPLLSFETTNVPEIYLPKASAAQAAFIPGVKVFGAATLLELCAHLSNQAEGLLHPLNPEEQNTSVAIKENAYPDLAEVVGNNTAKRALEVAAAGGHHLLMIGPPGSGKSMLAARLTSILPPLSDTEALDCAALLSHHVTGFTAAQWRQRPFRSPHHSASAAALVGGGNPPQPGEITLAHHGVLFLDELPEFNRHVLEMLREPLESGSITISRAGAQAHFPAACQLIAAMNPCPCGWLGDPRGRCRCTPDIAKRYQHRLSGPLLDRIDLHIQVQALTPLELAQRHTQSVHTETSATVAQRVVAARKQQIARQKCLNAALSSRDIDQHCQPDPPGQTLLHNATTQFGWSTRSYYRILKIARTIADLDHAQQTSSIHIAEAIQYRRGLLNN